MQAPLREVLKAGAETYQGELAMEIYQDSFLTHRWARPFSKQEVEDLSLRETDVKRIQN